MHKIDKTNSLIGIIILNKVSNLVFNIFHLFTQFRLIRTINSSNDVVIINFYRYK